MFRHVSVAAQPEDMLILNLKLQEKKSVMVDATLSTDDSVCSILIFRLNILFNVSSGNGKADTGRCKPFSFSRQGVCFAEYATSLGSCSR